MADNNDEYRILRGTSASDLEEKVSKLIHDGWKPLGGVAVDMPADIFLQAMTYEPQ